LGEGLWKQKQQFEQGHSCFFSLNASKKQNVLIKIAILDCFGNKNSNFNKDIRVFFIKMLKKAECPMENCYFQCFLKLEFLQNIVFCNAFEAFYHDFVSFFTKNAQLFAHFLYFLVQPMKHNLQICKKMAMPDSKFAKKKQNRTINLQKKLKTKLKICKNK